MGFGTLKCTWRRKFHGFITLLLQLPWEQTKSPILNHISILGSGCPLDFLLNSPCSLMLMLMATCNALDKSQYPLNPIQNTLFHEGLHDNMGNCPH